MIHGAFIESRVTILFFEENFELYAAQFKERYLPGHLSTGYKISFLKFFFLFFN